MTDDLSLLRQYVRNRAQDAFTEIVRRHVDLVYSAALRQVRSPQLAEEVAQSVFTDLAQNSGKLKPDTVLTAWLYQVTHRTAVDVVRKESRRQLREQVASEMNAMNATASDWTHIEPFLDEAMHALDDTDRAAVLLRYFENKSLREVGQTLGTSDDAAQKRVSRAVERLREFFSKRNVTIGASGLAAIIATSVVQAAPAGLAVTVSAAALAGTAVSTSTVITATKTIVMTTLQKTVITASLAVVAGAGIYEARQASTLRNQVQTLQQLEVPLTEQIAQLQRERDDATNRLDELFAENAQLKSHSNENELLKLRGEVGALRAQLASAKLLAANPDLTALRSSYATNDGSNQAMLDYLGNPTPPPPNLDAAYSKEGLISALQNAAQVANISLKKIEIDDSEFPFLVGVEVENSSDLRKLKDQMATMGEYNYTGGVGGNTRFVMNITPFGQYPAGRKHDIENRLRLRECMLSDKMDTAN